MAPLPGFLTADDFKAVWTELDAAYAVVGAAANFGAYDAADAVAWGGLGFTATLGKFPSYSVLDGSSVTTGLAGLAVNLAFVDLANAYVDWLEAGNAPILDIAKPRGEGAPGQSYHDNILGNLGDSVIASRFGTPFDSLVGTFDVTGDNDSDLVADPRSDEARLWGDRPYFAGTSVNDAFGASIAYDIAKGLSPALLDLDRNDLDPIDGQVYLLSGGAITTHAGLQAAIDAAAAGDTIVVGPGTFTGNISVNKADITILGPNAGTSGHTAMRGDEGEIAGNFSVLAAGEGLLVDGLKLAPTSTATNPILIRGADVTLTNSVITGQIEVGVNGFTLDGNLIGGMGSREGLSGVAQNALYSDSAAGGTDWTITNNVFDDFARGLTLASSGTGTVYQNLLVQDNVFKNFTVRAIQFGDNGQIDGAAITGNTFESGEAGVGVFSPVSPVSGLVIADNDFKDLTIGVWINAPAAADYFVDRTSNDFIDVAQPVRYEGPIAALDLQEVFGAAEPLALADVTVAFFEATETSSARYEVTSGGQAIAVVGVGSLDFGANSLHLVGPGGFDTIQAAIDAAVDGDTVYIAPGDYTGSANYDAATNTNAGNNPVGMLINKSIALIGVDASGAPITDADDVVATFTSGAQSNWGTNIHVTAPDVTVRGLEFLGVNSGVQNVNKVVEVIEGGFTLEASKIGAAPGATVGTSGFGALYIGDPGAPDPVGFVSAIDTVRIDGNVLGGSLTFANGAGYGVANPDFTVTTNTFLASTGIGVQGQITGFGWLNVPATPPTTLTGNSFDPATTRLLREIESDPAEIQIDRAYVESFIANNTVGDYAYVTDGDALRLVSYSEGAYFGALVDDRAADVAPLQPGQTLQTHLGAFEAAATGVTHVVLPDQSIQAAVNAAASGDTILVAPGTYTEDVVISKPLTLLSSGGAAATIIDGRNGQLGAITVTPGVNGVVIGDAAQGFTVLGNNGNGSVEYAAIYLQGAHDDVTIRGNIVEARGDAALMSEFSAVVTNVVVDGNTFSGQTFEGGRPGGEGFGTQFDNGNNVPRQLVTLGGNGQNTTAVTFTNNTVSGAAGGLNGLNQPQGNTLVTIDAANSLIEGNTFTGFTNRFATALRAREDNTDIRGNTFDASVNGSVNTAAVFIDTPTPGVYESNIFIDTAGFRTTQGTEGSDTLVGRSAIGEGFLGLGGDDVVLVGLADIVEGGDGVDTAVFAAGTTVEQIAAAADNLDGVELIRIEAADQGGPQTFVVVPGMSIQAAVEAADIEDTIVVADGSYGPITLDKGVTLVAAQGASPVINGAGVNQGAAIRVADGVEGASITGFTIEAGAGDLAAVYLVGNNDSISLEGNTITGGATHAVLSGGGMSAVMLTGNTISGAGPAAVVYVNGEISVSNVSSNVSLVDNMITGGANAGLLVGLESTGGVVQGNTFSGDASYAALELWGSGVAVGGAGEDEANSFAAFPRSIIDAAGDYRLSDLLANNGFARLDALSAPRRQAVIEDASGFTSGEGDLDTLIAAREAVQAAVNELVANADNVSVADFEHVGAALQAVVDSGLREILTDSTPVEDTTADALAAELMTFAQLRGSTQEAVLAEVQTGSYSTLGQVLDGFPAALDTVGLALVNDAADAAEVLAALTDIDVYVDDAALTAVLGFETADKEAVAADLLLNRPDGGYASLEAASTVLGQLESVASGLDVAFDADLFTLGTKEAASYELKIGDDTIKLAALDSVKFTDKSAHVAGSGGFSGVQAAVDAAADGDAVLVAAGEYAAEGKILIANKSISVDGALAGVSPVADNWADQTGETVIDGFTLNGTGGLTLDGVRLLGTGPESGNGLSGIQAYSSGDLTVRNSAIQADGYAESELKFSPAGIDVSRRDGDITVDNVLFTSFKAPDTENESDRDNAYGIFLNYGDAVTDRNVSVTNSKFDLGGNGGNFLFPKAISTDGRTGGEGDFIIQDNLIVNTAPAPAFQHFDFANPRRLQDDDNNEVPGGGAVDFSGVSGNTFTNAIGELANTGVIDNFSGFPISLGANTIDGVEYDNVIADVTVDSDATLAATDGESDFISGDDGDDIVTFTGNFADYAVSVNEGVITVAEGDETDTLIGVEALRFSDGFGVVEGMSLLKAIELADAGSTILLGAGTIIAPAQVAIDKSLTIKGAGEAQTTLDVASASYGVHVTANDVTLSDLTFDLSDVASYGLKVNPAGGATALTGFVLQNATVKGSAASRIDLNGVDDSSLISVTADAAGATKGVGIAVSDSTDITLTDIMTTGNPWGSVGLYAAGRSFEAGTSAVMFSGTYSFDEPIGAYADEEVKDGVRTEVSAIDFSGLGWTAVYKVQSASFRDASDGRGEDFTFFFDTEAAAIGFATGLAPDAVITVDTTPESVDAATGDSFIVAEGMSIQAAIDAASAGDTVVVAAGTYDEAVLVDVAGLTLLGANAGTAGAGERVAETRILQTLRFAADSVTADGFEFVVEANGRGVAPAATTAGVIRNSVFSADDGTGGVLAVSRGVQGDFYGFPQSLSVQDNLFLTDFGIAGTENMANLTVTGNAFRTATEAVGFGAGVSLLDVSGNEAPEGQLVNYTGSVIALGPNTVAGTAFDAVRLGTAAGDTVATGNGDDLIVGGPGDDVLSGGRGLDVLLGGDGDDVLDGQENPDILHGGAGNDILIGGGNADQLYGGEGDDTLEGGLGSDIMDGGPGNDVLIVAGFDTADGGEGLDTAVLADLAGADVATLQAAVTAVSTTADGFGLSVTVEGVDYTVAGSVVDGTLTYTATDGTGTQSVTGAELLVVPGVDEAAPKIFLVAAGMSIQTAIDAAAAGDTILVQAGAHDGTLVVDKAVHLVGPNAGRTGFAADRIDEAVIGGKVTITAEGASLDGFTLSKPGASTSDNSTNFSGWGGINLVVTGDGAAVSNSIVEAYGAEGGFAGSGFVTLAAASTFFGNVVKAGDGYNAGTDARGVSSVHINAGATDAVTVSGNHLLVSTNVVATPNDADALFLNNAGDVVIDGNLLSGTDGGFVAFGNYGKLTITDNTVENYAKTGLRLFESTNATKPDVILSGNSIDASGTRVAFVDGDVKLGGDVNSSGSLALSANLGEVPTIYRANDLGGDFGVFANGTLSLFDDVVDAQTAAGGAGIIWSFLQEKFLVFEGMSIQAAVDAASDGDTIAVEAGTFNEVVTVNVEGLTIEGPNAGVAGTGTRSLEAVLTETLKFAADNVTVDGLQFEVSGNSRGVGPAATTGGTVKNSVFTAGDDNASTRGVQGDWYGEPTDLTVTGNLFETKFGIAGTEDMTNLTVTDNVFDTGTEAIGFGAGVTLADVSGNTAPDGQFVNYSAAPIELGANTVGGIALDAVTLGTNAVETIASVDGSDELIAGQDGDDVATFSGNFADYTVSVSDGVITVAKGGETDTLTGIKALKFADGFGVVEGLSIQDAVDAASGAESVLVAGGTYREQVVIDGKDLTLRALVDGTIIEAPDALVMGHTAAGNGGDRDRAAVVMVREAASATVEGFVIDGRGVGNTVFGADRPDFHGVLFFDAAGSITGNTVTGIRDPLKGDGEPSGAQRGNAIVVINDDGAMRSVSVTGNTVADFQKNGLTVSGDGLDAVIDDNTVTGSGFLASTGAIAQNGIQVSFGATGSVSNNIVTEIGFQRDDFITSHVLAYQAGALLSITGNTLTGTSGPSHSGGVVIFDSANAMVTDNTLSQLLYGVYLVDELGDPVVEENAFTSMVASLQPIDGGAQDGSNLEDGNPIVVEGANVITSAKANLVAVTQVADTAGRDVFNGSDAGDDVFDGGAGDDVIFGNAGNDDLKGGAGADYIDGSVGDDTIYGGAGVDEIRAGDGDDVVYADLEDTIDGGDGTDTVVLDKLVTLDQVLQAITDGELSFAGVELLKGGEAGDGEAQTWFVVEGLSIQAAVDAAADGDAIVVAPGAYAEVVTIPVGKTLSVVGQGADTVLDGGLVVRADGASIEDLAISNGGPTAGSTAGVYIAASDVSLTDLTLTGPGQGAAGGQARGVLTEIGKGAGLSLVNVTASDWATGVYMNPGASGATVSGSTLSGNFVGMSIDAADSVTLTGNTLGGTFEDLGLGAPFVSLTATGNTFVSGQLGNYTNEVVVLGSSIVEGQAHASVRIGTVDGDVFVDAPAEAELIIGGEGFDAVRFSGNAAEFTVDEPEDGVQVVTGASGVDTLRNVEALVFDDGVQSRGLPVQLFDVADGFVAAFETIQEAVDAASADFTIKLDAGDFAAFTVDVPGLAIVGANAGIRGDGARGAESRIVIDAGALPVSIEASGAVIDGVTIATSVTGGGLDDAAALSVGLAGGSLADVTVRNSVIEGDQAGTYALVTATAVSAESGTGFVFADNRLKNASGNLGQPLRVTDSDAAVTGNLLEAASVLALLPDVPRSVTVTGNTITPTGTAAHVEVSGATPSAPLPSGSTVTVLPNLFFGDDATNPFLVVSGTNGSDVIAGSSGRDELSGFDGNDSFQHGAGNDVVAGGDGVDAVTLQAARDDYALSALTKDGGSFTLTDVDLLRGGVDVLSDVEVLQFAGGERVLIVGAGGFQSISAALDAAQAGDTLLVASGDYAETAVVTVPGVTIEAAGAVVLTGGIHILADGVTLRDLTIAEGAAIAGETAGVYVQGEGATLSGLTLARSAAPAAARGVVTATGQSADLIVSDSTFSGWATGIYLNPGADGATLSGNGFTDNQVGVSADDPSGVLLAANHFGDQALEDLGVGSLTNTAGSLTLQGNAFDGDTPLHVANYSPTMIDARGESFDGQPVSLAGRAALFALSERIRDAVDADGVGLVRLTERTVHLTATGSPSLARALAAASSLLSGSILSVGVAVAAGDYGNVEAVVPSAVTLDPDLGVTGLSVRLADGESTLTLSGGAGLGIVGNAGANTLTGNAGANRIDGSAGADTMIGGAGDDVYIVDDAGDVVVESAGGGQDRIEASVDGIVLPQHVEMLTLTGDADLSASVGHGGGGRLVGNSGANTLTGGAGDDLLEGGDGNDSLDGGLGADTMVGGVGDDSYVVDNAGDMVVESANQGLDTVTASIAYALPDHVENLFLVGAADRGEGNDLANLIDDQTTAGAALLFGGGGDDILMGGAGDNLIDGGSGADAMSGGAGDDSYVVDNAGDMVTEAVDEGTDTVIASVAYTLPEHVEILVLVGAAASGVGNNDANTLEDRTVLGNASLSGAAGYDILIGGAGSNRLDGGAGADSMTGGRGDDVYVVDSVGDTVVELPGGGFDTVETGLDGYVLPDHVEAVVATSDAGIALFGNALDNVFTGGEGNDTLDGGAGGDVMRGGLGDDVYVVDDVRDRVEELAGQGVDRIESSVSFTLPAEVESLVLTGSANLAARVGHDGGGALTGNTGDNRLTGASGADRLDGVAGSNLLEGGAGDDVLLAGSGSDRMIGGAGVDVFTYAAGRGGSFTVLDFQAGDRIGFAGMGDGFGFGDLTIVSGRRASTVTFNDGGTDVTVTLSRFRGVLEEDDFDFSVVA